MTTKDIILNRLANQQLTTRNFSKPEELVRWMGCIQSQDIAGAKWAIGSRIRNITEADIDKSFNEGKILRTHVLRPTWHFVSPDDIGWMLELTAPKVKMLSRGMLKKWEIDDSILKKSKKVIEKVLTGGKQLTRDEVAAALKKGKINTDELRITLLLMDAELDGLICSGARSGKQMTYALLEERVPLSQRMDRDAAIAALTSRYFISRGPATVADLAWWSGLSLADAKMGIALNMHTLVHEVVAGISYWCSPLLVAPPTPKHSVFLLPAFDEYNVAYKDRSHSLLAEHRTVTGHGIAKPVIIIDGQVGGTWKRTEYKNNLQVEVQMFSSVNKRLQQEMTSAAKAYAQYLDKELMEVVFT